MAVNGEKSNRACAPAIGSDAGEHDIDSRREGKREEGVGQSSFSGDIDLQRGSMSSAAIKARRKAGRRAGRQSGLAAPSNDGVEGMPHGETLAEDTPAASVASVMATMRHQHVAKIL